MVLPSDLEIETAEEKLCVLPVDAGEFGQMPSTNVTVNSCAETVPQSINEEKITPLSEEDCKKLIGPILPPMNEQLEGKTSGNTYEETKQKSKKDCICDNISDRGFYVCIFVFVSVCVISKLICL